MDDLPLGFAMSLAQNPQAMEYFASLPESKKQEVLSHTHEVHSKSEMHQFVENLTQNF